MRNFDCATESKANYLYQPYDFLLMSAAVPREFPLLFIDAIADELSVDETKQEISEFNPQIIVVAMANTSWDEDIVFLKDIRNRFEASQVYVFGDVFFDHSYKSYIKKWCDGVLNDPILLKFTTEGIRFDSTTNKQTLKRPIPVEVGFPRHELFQNTSYRWPFSRHKKYTTIFMAWGCPYSCDYCIMSNFPNYWRPHSDVMSELDEIYKLGIREIYIGDRSFGLPYKNIKTILQQMKSYQFSWSTYLHPNQYTPELLNLMHESGCHTIIVGFESFNQLELKQFGRHVKKDRLENLVKHANELGIDICGDFIIGLPHEDRLSVSKTIKWALDLNIQFASFNVATPLPGTSIRAQALEDGRLQEREMGLYDSLGKHEVLKTKHLSASEIKKLKKQAVRRFYLRPKYLWNRLKGARSLEHLIIQAQEGLMLLWKH